MKPQFTIGIFGIIFDERKRVLLCHRRNYDLWNLTGGTMKNGESPWDGLKREVKEETGLEVEISKLAGVYSKPDKNEVVFSFISISMVQNMLTNHLYYGAMIYKGEYHLATHEPLISKRLFDKCQEVMSKRGKQKEIRKHNFAFLGLMKCGSCNCSITAEKQKGRNYYRCTKKKGLCQEKHFLREENLVEQIKTFLQKVSLSSRDTKKVLAEFQKDETREKEKSVSIIQNLKTEIAEIETKLEKLLDAYLGEVISATGYKARKEKLLTQKIELGEKIRDFEQKGLSRLEPAREFVLSLNQAQKLLSTRNYSEMTTFLKNIGSNHILRNRQLVFSPKIQYELAAERSEATSSCLPFSKVCGQGESNSHFLVGNEMSCH